MGAYVNKLIELHHFLPLETCIYQILFFENILLSIFLAMLIHDLIILGYRRIKIGF